jgi:hypothetical protein
MFTFLLGFSTLFFMPDIFPYLFYILPEFKVYFYDIYTTILVLQICNLIRKSWNLSKKTSDSIKKGNYMDIVIIALISMFVLWFFI